VAASLGERFLKPMLGVFADTLLIYVAASLTRPMQPVLDTFSARTGIVVQREVKHAPWKGRPPTGSGDRLGTIGITAVSSAWVETKSLSFIEAVLKVN